MRSGTARTAQKDSRALVAPADISCSIFDGWLRELGIEASARSEAPVVDVDVALPSPRSPPSRQVSWTPDTLQSHCLPVVDLRIASDGVLNVLASGTRSLVGHARRPRPRSRHDLGIVGQRPCPLCRRPCQRCARSLLAIVVPTDSDVDTLLTDTRFFLSVLEGSDDAALATTVLPLPSHEVDPYRGLAPHLQVASARAPRCPPWLQARRGWSSHRRRRSCRGWFGPSSCPCHDRSQARSGHRATAPRREVGRAGYTRQDPVDEHGEFCVRGGIVDVFPPGDEEPIRIEFVGDTVESLRRYDPSTQRSQSDDRPDTHRPDS